MPRCDSGLPCDTRNFGCTSGSVFERPPAQEGQSSALFNGSKNLASSSQELRPDITGTARRQQSEMKREPLNTSIPLPHFQRGGDMSNHIGGTYSHSCMIGFPRFPISKLHLGKLPDCMEFQNWKVNFKTEVWTKSADPHLTMQWIKESRQQNQLTIF